MDQQRSYVPFVLLTSPRSGTHMLRTALMGNPKIIMYGEMFNSNQQILPFLPYLINEHPKRIIEEHIYHPFPARVHGVGFPLHDFEAFNGKNPYWCDVHKVLSKIPNLHVVRLKRKNLAEKFVSNLIALRTNTWNLYYQKPNKDNFIRIRVPTRKFEEYFMVYQRESSRVEALLEDKPTYQVNYDELVSNFTTVTADIQQFLGVDSVPLKPATHKQSQRSLRDTLENFDEVAEYFSSTPYEHFFK